MGLVVTGVLLTLVPILIAVNLRRGKKQRDAWAARAVPVPGEVVDVKWRVRTDRRGGTNMQTSRGHLILRYTAPSGEELEVESFEGSSPPAAKKGASVTVLLDPDDYRRARISADGPAGAIMTGLTGCLVVGFALVGLVLIVFAVAFGV